MITIPRSWVRTLRLVFSRGLGLSGRSRHPPVHFQGTENGLRIRAKSDLAVMEFLEPGPPSDAKFAVAFEALKRCEGSKADPVVFEPVDGDKVILSWQEHGIPQMVQFPAETPDNDFPPIPKRMQSHGPELLNALRDAVDTTDAAATRYALGCIQLRAGKPGRNEGRIVATDGRQLLVQSGFAFPWKGDVLVPASRIFACRELQGDSQVEIGKSEDWLTLRAGNWTIHLRIEKEARFPHVDDRIPEGSDPDSTLHLSETDAEFLTGTIIRLPAGKEQSAPVTVDLNGHVAIRAKAEDQPAPTELVLAESSYQGEPVVINTNRQFPARALRLGFRDVHFRGPEIPAFCRDDRRSFIWAVLEKEGTIKPAPNATRILSTGPETPATPRVNRPRRPDHTMPKPNTTDNGHASNGADHEEPPNSSLLEQAETLRDTLTESLTQTRDLIAALKRQKKQTRLMQTTLQSLRALQSIHA